MQAQSFRGAERELVLAEQAQTNSDKLAISRSRLFALQGDYPAAEQELLAAEKDSKQLAVLRFEEGRLSFEKGENPWQSKTIFKEALGLPDTAHFAGETTHQLAKAYYNACRLKTGEAEEGLEELNWSIDRFRAAVPYVDSLRPILAELLIERAAYHVSHKEPAGAIVDLKAALLYCSYFPIIKKAQKIKDELSWRYKAPLV